MKRYNWKARQVVNTTVDNTNTRKIQLDLLVKGSYDESNELVLPSTKRKTEIKDHRPLTKILSKKHRKRLEKVIEKKKKKENRAALLESLSKVRQVVNTTNDDKKTKKIQLDVKDSKKTMEKSC